ncbi:hypothetical protein CC1G_11849 [Coprinopsis cinerea okayama7|uniref:DUF6534 domain-containing protein n=1 Tax=Coprinopsis cinerea (strain Okayama-7 / 130 / ATCC MYA-4618 / FGSC 9003) TaxID=240176 RepID=A8PH16_COPC7|nr:hypothetical protein CC1G_11849 [Coprinopsis cinerea okayama7\|eukprot:XP_001841321.2 hypothetical protein CC1G_11849 [Coprinopsis cinerea okayama7\
MVEPTVHNTYGALVIGVSFAIFLFGAISLQAYRYYFAFPNDRIGFRYLVTVIWFLELGHTAGITYELYTVAVTRNDTVLAFPGLGVALLIGGLVTMLVQCFFARRLWKLLPRPYNLIGLLCVVLAIVRAIGSTFLATKAITSKDVTSFQLNWNWLVTALLSLGAFLDLAIAASMLSFLMVQRNDRLGQFGQLMDRLVAYTIRTGLFTSVTAVVVLICFQTMPGNFIWIATYAFLAKLYSNSLLAARQLRNAVTEAPERFHRSKPPSIRTTESRAQSIQERRTGTFSLRPSRPPMFSFEMHSPVYPDDSHIRGYWEELPGTPSSPQSPSRAYYGINEKPRQY